MSHLHIITILMLYLDSNVILLYFRQYEMLRVKNVQSNQLHNTGIRLNNRSMTLHFEATARLSGVVGA